MAQNLPTNRKPAGRLLRRLLPALIVLSRGDGMSVARATELDSLEAMRGDMHAIASDATEGRFAGSPGYKRASDYAVQVFQEACLDPAFSEEKGEPSYVQAVPLVRENFGPATTLTIRRRDQEVTLGHSAGTFVVLNPGRGREQTLTSRPVFIGYGIHEPKHGWDDLAGVDVEGRWVILLDGAPGANGSMGRLPEQLRNPYADRRTGRSRKYQELVKHQALGALILPDEYIAKNWESTVIRAYRFDYTHYVGDALRDSPSSERALPMLLIHPDLAQRLMKDQAFDPLNNRGTYHSFSLDNVVVSVSLDHRLEKVDCYNVAALLPGTDPALKRETVMVCAHMDHLGKVGSNVYNGANDDASGCVLVLQTARNLTSHPPKRAVLFALFTGEELGRIGSRHFVGHAPLPLDDITLNINIEQIGSKTRSFPGVWAIGAKEFRRSFLHTGGAWEATELRYDNVEEDARIIVGTDTESFYERGIPTILMGSGGFPEYHSPEDDVDVIDFDHLGRAAALLETLVRELANR